jgi:hypothetical protein
MIQAFQTSDITNPLDPRDKVISKSRLKNEKMAMQRRCDAEKARRNVNFVVPLALDMNPSMTAAGNSVSLHHESGISTDSDPAVSPSGTVLGSIDGTQKTIQKFPIPGITNPQDPRVKHITIKRISKSQFRQNKLRALKAAGNVNFVVPLVVTPAVLSALSV